MRLFRRFWRRLRETVNLRRRDDDFADEVESHIRMLTEDNVRSGMPPADARRAARLKFGNIDATTEKWREQRRLPLIDTLTRDVQFAIRGLAKEPGFAAVCAVTLALGIGANTAIFSVVDAVLIRALPYPDAHQLVQVWETNPRANRWGDWASYPDFDDWRRESRAFEAMAAFRNGRFRLTHGEHPEMLVGVRVTPDIFWVLRISPMLGRLLPTRDTRVAATLQSWVTGCGSDGLVGPIGRWAIDSDR